MEQTEIHLQKMEERLDEMEEKLDEIDKKLSYVVDALVGNPLVKSDGLVKRLERFESEIQELKDFRKRILYSVSTIVAIGLTIEVLIKIYTSASK